MIVFSAITAGLAVASLVIGVFLRFLVLDLLFRVEALEAHRNALQIKLARVANRRDRRPKEHAVSLATPAADVHKFALGDRVSFKGVEADPAWGEGVVTDVYVAIVCIRYTDQLRRINYALRPPGQVRLLAVVMPSGGHPFEEVDR